MNTTIVHEASHRFSACESTTYQRFFLTAILYVVPLLEANVFRFALLRAIVPCLFVSPYNKFVAPFRLLQRGEHRYCIAFAQFAFAVDRKMLEVGTTGCKNRRLVGAWRRGHEKSQNRQPGKLRRWLRRPARKSEFRAKWFAKRFRLLARELYPETYRQTQYRIRPVRRCARERYAGSDVRTHLVPRSKGTVRRDSLSEYGFR
jgi:hypothetical protein